MKKTFFVLSVILLLTGCASVPVEISEELTAPELFQNAQEYADQGNYDAAHAYIEAVFERFSDDPTQLLTAEYHRAHYHAKQGLEEQAAEEFKAILTRYENQDPEQDPLPEWVRVLAQNKYEALTETEE
jgi:outer membrane protein assembly factor BamD (BamD/ComL family)